MNRPEPKMIANEEDASNVAPAESWGEKEVAREIALLEAHVQQDNITCAVNALAFIVERENAGSFVETTLVGNIEEELRQSYIDYVMSVIDGQALRTTKAIEVIRTQSRRAAEFLSRYRGGLATLRSHGLTVAMAIQRLQRAPRLTSILLLKLRKAANSACFRVPLFAYGPELSEFRHRLR